ncbi:MAG: alkaline phosphatase D family protein [Alphaproteobacteria bacterium]|nr:alkaline phosphatase D family protein [Alphaproteobacteria bacterium]
MTLLLLLTLACTDKAAVDSGTGDGADSGHPPTATRPAEPDPWAAPGAEGTALWGIAAGDPRPDRVILGARADVEQATLVVMADDGAGGWTEVHRETLDRGDGEVSVRAELSGLVADTVYAYAFYEGTDTSGARSPVGRFRTALDDGDWRVVTVGATSCLGNANPPWPSMSHVAALDPDVFLLLGDTVYADGAVTLDEYRAKWDTNLALSGLRDTLAATGTVATWDDHEVDNNWSWDAVTPDQYDAALTAYRESLPQTVGPTGGVWRQIHWGQVLDLFVLDVRSERDEDAALYIGADQEAWLLDELTSSSAAFKLVLTSVPIVDYSDLFGSAAGEDRWQGWPEQRTRVLQAIDDAGVRGLLWVSGDVHHAMVQTVGIEGSDLPGQEQWEVTVGSAGSTPNVGADLYENDESHYRLLFSDWNSVLFTLDPGTGEAHVRFVGDDGADIATISLYL